MCVEGNEGRAGEKTPIICLLLYFHYGFPNCRFVVVVFIAAFKCRAGMNIDGRLNKR